MLAKAAQIEVELVMAQPHRRDAKDPRHEWLESELGRFCLRHKLREAIKDAGEEWAKIARLYQLAWGAPVAEHHGGQGSGQGPSMETVANWKAQLVSIQEALYGDNGMNKARYSATMRLCLKDQQPPPELVRYALDGLRILAIELGKMSARDQPFHAAA